MAPDLEADSLLRKDGDGVLVFVHLQPSARRTTAAGVYGSRLKVAVSAPPLEGRANEALLRWIAGRLNVPRRQVRLIAGEHSRDKTLLVHGVDTNGAKRLLAPR